MKVTITYFDGQALTPEEIVAQAVANYGPRAKIDISPESTLAYDHIYFGIQSLLTHRQVSAFHDPSKTYAKEITPLRREVMEKLTEILDQVIIDNETKII